MSLFDTLTARGLEEHVRVSLIFVIIDSFMLFTVLILLSFMYFLIHDSRGLMILKNNWLNLVGLCHFPLNT